MKIYKGGNSITTKKPCHPFNTEYENIEGVANIQNEN